MDAIRRQVARASRRMTVQQFLARVPWTLFAALLVAACAVAVPKFWPLEVDPAGWTFAWIGGAVAAGILAAGAWTYVTRHDPLDAALAIDRLYGFKERVSSSLSLSDDERATPAGRALVADAQRRVQQVDVSDLMALELGRRALLPLIPALLIAVMALVGNAVRQEATAAPQSDDLRQQVRTSTAELTRQVQEQKRMLEEKGLPDAQALLLELERGLAELERQEAADPRQAMIRINELASQLEERRRQLSHNEQLRRQLDKLRELQQGPADRLARSLRQGEFQRAIEELERLQQQLEDGELDAESIEQLQRQLDELREKLEALVEAHRQAKQELQERIERAERSGNEAEAAELREQLTQLQQQDQLMSQLEQMADRLGECSSCLAQGNGQSAAAALGEIASQLGTLQQESDELAALDYLLDQIAASKNAMNCGECSGGGCSACSGGMFGQGGEGEGDGLGDGIGYGARPEEATDTSHYDARVAAEPQPGESVRIGEADGPNLPGRSRAAVAEQIESSLANPTDPLTQQRLSRAQREHVREYFESLRDR